MVSSAIKITQDELLAALRRFSREYADDPEWQRRRAEFPADWPI
jgi:hypothetical protein